MKQKLLGTAPWLESSVDAGEISMRAKGIMRAVAAVLLSLGLLNQIDVNQEQADLLIDALTQLIFWGGTVWGFVESIYGYIRRQK